MTFKKHKKVVVAMSGGVDSSVVAAVLKKAGYKCVGMYLNFWKEPRTYCASGFPQNKCCTTESLESARKTAARLKIPFYVVNVKKPFKSKVVDYFLKEYACGQTPNPCIQCNKFIKFGELLKTAKKLGADFLATGHYARIKKNSKTGLYELFRARDKIKDQSYFLASLSQKRLAGIMFPLGNFLKKDTFELAQKYGLKNTFNKKESAGVCFFPEAAPQAFLKRHLNKKYFKGGPIVTLDNKIIGSHRGLPLYTIGQRHGLGIGGVAGEPEGRGWHVIAINRKKNALVVGRREDVLKRKFVCGEIYFISGLPEREFTAAVRIRHRTPPVPCTVKVRAKKTFVHCQKNIWAVSPGQVAVFYKGEKVLASAKILPETYA